MRRPGRLELAAAGALALAASFAFAGAKVVSAPAAPKVAKPRAPRALPGDPVELKTVDGWTLAARYSPAQQNQYAFILLHGAGGRKEDWYLLAKAMARRGLGVFCLDLRGHGASQNPPPGQPANHRQFKANKDENQWADMIHDIEAAVAYLKDAKVAETSVALGGADVGSSVALKYAAVHPQVPMLFMLSPGMAYREVLTVNAMRAYAKRPVLMVVAADDHKSTPETAILYNFARISAGPDNVVKLDVEREHGAKMTTVNKGLITQILDWVENPVKPPELPEASSGTVPGGPDGLPTDEQLKAPEGGNGGLGPGEAPGGLEPVEPGGGQIPGTPR